MLADLKLIYQILLILPQIIYGNRGFAQIGYLCDAFHIFELQQNFDISQDLEFQ